MPWVDTHCHLDFPDFDHDRDQVLQACRQQGVQRLVLAAISRQHWSRLWQLVDSTEQPQLYGTLGLHPYFLAEHQPSDLALLRQQLAARADHPKLCALGEIGLDFYLPELDREQQVYYFTEQLKLAQHFALPVILHVRKAHAEVIALLKQHAVPRGGIVHAFNGSAEQAQDYIKLGFMLGIGGAYTWPRARKLRTTLPRLPLNHLVLETDSPDMSPAFNAGQRNSPALLPRIGDELAALLDIPATQLAAHTSANAQRLFGWPTLS